MRKLLPQTLLPLLALLLATSASAEIYSIEANKSSHQVKAQFLNADDVVHVIQPTRLSLANAESLSVPLPNGEVWTAAKTDSYAIEHGQAWFGELTAFAGGPEGRFMLIALKDGMFLGEFSLADDRFLIWPHADSGEHELIQKAPRKIASCGVEDHPEFLTASRVTSDISKPAVGLLDSNDILDEVHKAGSLGSSAHQNTGGVTTLDILPLYHSALSYNDVQNQYIAWVAQSNQVFNVSNIPASFALVSNPIAISAASLPATECFDGISDSLGWIQDRPDVMQSLRNQHGGDFVALAIPQSATSCGGGKGQFPNDACGVASLPVRDGFGRKVAVGAKRFWTQRSFITARLGCGTGDLTFAHELGHTFGAIHDDSEPYIPINSSAFGFHFQYKGEARATVMACADTGEINIYDEIICNRVQHFSSATEPGPGGVAIGDSSHDNRQLIINKAPSYGTFRSRSGPMMQILSPVRSGVVDIQSNYFEAQASEVVNGVTVDISDQVIWKVRTLEPVANRDQVILDMGQGRDITDFDFSPLIGQIDDEPAFELIAVVVGSSGARAQWRIPIQIDQRPPVASFTDSCNNLECTFDASASTGVGGVASYDWSFKVTGCIQLPGIICFLGSSQETPPQLSHFFPGYGSYDVTLSVVDSLGRRSQGVMRTINLAAPASNFAQVGAWHNPDRTGHSIDLYRNNQDLYVLFWYTYEEFTNEPTWYLSDAAPIVNSQFHVPLFKVTRGANDVLTVSNIGNIDLDFSDPNSAAFQWDFSLNDRRALGWERFEHHYGNDHGGTGLWYDPNGSGWGLQINETLSSINSGGSLMSLAFYDNAGQPRWVSGSKQHSPLQRSVMVPVDYHVGQNLCPFESCSGGTPSLTSSPAGSVTLIKPLSSGSQWYARTAVTIPGGSLGLGDTPVQRLAGY